MQLQHLTNLRTPKKTATAAIATEAIAMIATDIVTEVATVKEIENGAIEATIETGNPARTGRKIKMAMKK